MAPGYKALEIDPSQGTEKLPSRYFPSMVSAHPDFIAVGLILSQPIEEGRRVRLKKDYETEFWPKVKLSQGDTGLVESGQLSRTVGVSVDA